MFFLYEKAIDEIFGFCETHKPQWFNKAEWDDASCTLLLTTALLLFLWPLCKSFYARRSCCFAALDNNKQWYVVANLSKAVCLAVMCLNPWFFESFEHVFASQSLLGCSGNENGSTAREAIQIKRSSALYLASDAAALLLVPDLPSTTVFHHYVAVLLGLLLFATDLKQANVTLMIALYGAWSALAFPVNLFLALRFSAAESWWLPHLAWLSLFVYVGVCVANWSWHALWFYEQVFWHNVLETNYGLCILAYAGAVVVLARDDLILMSWLWQRATRKRVVVGTKEKEKAE